MLTPPTFSLCLSLTAAHIDTDADGKISLKVLATREGEGL